MRLIGSFHTIVTHGLSGSCLSAVWSADFGRSTSAGATLTGTHLPIRSLPLVDNSATDESLSLPGDTALLTDQYELTMVQASLRSGAAERKAVFEVFARHLPHGRRYGVVAGTGRLLDAIANFRFTAADLDFLREADIVDEATLRYLESYRFRG